MKIEFKTKKERRYWLYVFLAILAIGLSLIFGNPLQQMLQNKDVQASIFILGMLMMLTTIVLKGLHSNTNTMEWMAWIGLSAVYLMLFLRLGLSERSHMVEYSLLAILSLQAFQERHGKSNKL